MANYKVTLEVIVENVNVENTEYFEEEPMEFLIETALIDDAEVTRVERLP